MNNTLENYAPNGFLRLNSSLYGALYDDIKAFREVFNLPVEDGGTGDTEILHDNLYEEEFLEMVLSTNRVDKIDAIVDQVYVMFGRLVNNGLPHYDSARIWAEYKQFVRQIDLLIQSSNVLKFDFIEAWNIVHRSNLSKVCLDRKQREDTVRKYTALGVEVEVEDLSPELCQSALNQDEPAFIIKCKKGCMDINDNFYPAGKVLKNAHYIPADLSAL